MSGFDQKEQHVQTQYNTAYVYQTAPAREVDEETLAAAHARLERLPLDAIPPVTPLPRGSRMPFAPNPLFVGREDDLRALATALKRGETTAIAAATGMGGIGKTQLAAEFAHRYGTYFAGGVHWVSLADPNAVEAEIAACALAGMPEMPPNPAALPAPDLVRWVLAAWKSALPRLLVFDNCEAPALLAKWRPPTGGCRVLVTSRRGIWPDSLGVSIHALHTLPRPESIALLRKFHPELPFHPDAPQVDLELAAIAAELGDLPLALHLAGSFLKRYRHAVTLPGYLAQLRNPALLDHPSMQGAWEGLSPTGHERHVARTFALSVERLQPEDETDAQTCALAQALLARAAYFAPGEPVPRDLLKATAPPNEAKLREGLLIEDALARLVDLGLLETEADGALRLHRLVGAFVRGTETADSETPGEAQTAVEETVLSEANRLNNAGYPAPLLAWQTHLRHVTDTARTREDETTAGLCNTLGFHLKMIADYAGARPYYEQTLAIHRKALGEAHPDTALSLNNLGALLDSMGDYAGARPYYEQALAIRKQALGEAHPDTAQSLNNLGYLLQAMGDYAGARPYYELALAIYRKALGEAHPDTARSLNNLGYLLRAMGELTGARPYYEQALAIYRKALGETHPDTARSLNNLGALLQAMGDYAGARPYYEQALAIHRKALGEAHPDTARSLNNLGALHFALQEFGEAARYFDEALTVRQKVLGEKHPDTAQSLWWKGTILANAGEKEKAKQEIQKAVEIYIVTLGENHQTTKQCKSMLDNLG